jgi:hypothetical protein
MTRTDVVASSRPQTTGAASMRMGSPRALRRLLVLPVALLLAVALVAPTTALAASTTESGYNQKPPEPKSGTSPSKEATTPKKATAPAKATSTPTTTTPTAKTLPFTGFDLRWTIGIGLLLMGAGFSIVTVQRRQQRGTGTRR